VSVFAGLHRREGSIRPVVEQDKVVVNHEEQRVLAF
jgi:hypothetical protein